MWHPTSTIRLTLVSVAAVFGLACTPPVEAETAGQGAPPQENNAAAAPAEGAERYQPTAPPELREAPPPATPSPAWTFPKIHHNKLANGLPIRVVERHALPIVEIRLVIQSGQATDGKRPGVAVLAGELLKVGGTGQWTSRQLLEKIESLGSSLNITTSRDSTTLSMSVTRNHFETILGLLGQVVQKPQLNAGEYRKLERREVDRVESLATSSAGWAANMVMYRELYGQAGTPHPYGIYDATPKQVEQVSVYDCRTWLNKHVVPDNAILVIAGDLSPEEANQAADSAFGKWRGKAPSKPTLPAPSAPEELRVFLVDRPDSPQAEVRLASFGPSRQSPTWATMKTVNQILGGGVAGRLFLDVREQRSLAYRTNSSLETVAQGAAPLVLVAGTQTAKAGLTLQALIEHFERLGREPVKEEELEVARRYLSDVFLLRMETVGAVASMTAQLGILGLPDDYYDKYRKEVEAVTVDEAKKVAANHFKAGHAIAIVAGDAKRLETPLSHFGSVTVVDPKKAFQVVRVTPRNPEAKIELERVGGT